MEKRAVKKYSGFECSDGRIFAEKAIAIRHEQDIFRKEQISEFVDEHFCRDMSSFEIVEAIEENHVLLRRILTSQEVEIKLENNGK